MKAVRKRRLILIGLVLAAVVVAVGLSLFALQRHVTYMFSPTYAEAGEAPAGTRSPLGGIAQEGSVRHIHDTLTVDFVAPHRSHQVPVVHTGLLPDLFRGGQSGDASAHGQDGTFVATQVLAKH